MKRVFEILLGRKNLDDPRVHVDAFKKFIQQRHFDRFGGRNHSLLNSIRLKVLMKLYPDVRYRSSVIRIQVQKSRAEHDKKS
jgi:hypothetical protein